VTILLGLLPLILDVCRTGASPEQGLTTQADNMLHGRQWDQGGAGLGGGRGSPGRGVRRSRRWPDATWAAMRAERCRLHSASPRRRRPASSTRRRKSGSRLCEESYAIAPYTATVALSTRKGSSSVINTHPPRHSNDLVFRGAQSRITRLRWNYVQFSHPGYMNGRFGHYEIGVRPWWLGRRVIVHHFFRPARR